jgi:hypothetical protein
MMGLLRMVRIHKFARKDISGLTFCGKQTLDNTRSNQRTDAQWSTDQPLRVGKTIQVDSADSLLSQNLTVSWLCLVCALRTSRQLGIILPQHQVLLQSSLLSCWFA